MISTGNKLAKRTAKRVEDVGVQTFSIKEDDFYFKVEESRLLLSAFQPSKQVRAILIVQPTSFIPSPAEFPTPEATSMPSDTIFDFVPVTEIETEDGSTFEKQLTFKHGAPGVASAAVCRLKVSTGPVALEIIKFLSTGRKPLHRILVKCMAPSPDQDNDEDQFRSGGVCVGFCEAFILNWSEVLGAVEDQQKREKSSTAHGSRYGFDVIYDSYSTLAEVHALRDFADKLLDPNGRLRHWRLPGALEGLDLSSKKYAYINRIWVSQNSRRHGIGTMMMDKALETIREKFQVDNVLEEPAPLSAPYFTLGQAEDFARHVGFRKYFDTKYFFRSSQRADSSANK